MTGATAKAAHLWKRDDLDWYIEPAAATQGLLTVEAFSGAVLDPACGGGNIVEAMLADGHCARGTDIKRRTDASWFIEERDFVDPAYPWRSPNIVTNPPFYRAKGTEAFIRLALERATAKVAIFTDIKFLAGQGRANGLFREHPPTKVWIITPRPSCPPGEHIAAGGAVGGGTADWVWLVWSLSEIGAPTELGWIRTGIAA